MKSLKLILGLALGTTGLGSTIAFGVANNVAQQNSVAPAEAAISSSTVFYLEGNLNGVNCWNTDDQARKFQYSPTTGRAYLYWTFKTGDTFKVYNQTNNKWAGYHSNLGSNFSGSTSENITVVNGGTYRIVMNDNHTTYGDISYAWTTDSITKSGMHIWATSDNANWISSNSFTKIGFWSASISYSEVYADYTFTGLDSTKLIYYRFTVPTDITGMKFLRYGNEGGVDKLWDGSMGDITTINANNLYYIWYQSGWSTPKTSNGAAKDGSFSAEAFGKAIDNIQTCSSDSKTGYMAYQTIKDNFYDKLASSEAAKLTITNIKDYSKSDYDSNSKSYEGIEQSENVSVATKWNYMSTLYATGNNSNYILKSVTNKQTAVVVIVASMSVALLSVGLFFFIKKKHI